MRKIVLLAVTLAVFYTCLTLTEGTKKKKGYGWGYYWPLYEKWAHKSGGSPFGGWGGYGGWGTGSGHGPWGVRNGGWKASGYGFGSGSGWKGWNSWEDDSFWNWRK